MKLLCVTLTLLAAAGLSAIAAPHKATSLSSGSKVELRVRQVIPADGLSRGERLLNSLPPLQAGDVFTAELTEPPGQQPLIMAGYVESVTPPGRFGRPGKVSVKLAWPAGNQSITWPLDIEDQRFSSAQRRRAITTLFLAEGAALGASAGAQVDRARTAATLGGAGGGLLLGLAYASFQTGQAASLEPGDTLSVLVGTMSAKKLPPEAPLTVFPAREPGEEKHGRKSP
jgi:hypothetical protein